MFATSSMKKYIPVPVDIGPVSLPAIPKLIDTYLQDLHRLFQVKSIWGRKRLRSPRIIIGSPMTVRLVSLCSYFTFIIYGPSIGVRSFQPAAILNIKTLLR